MVSTSDFEEYNVGDFPDNWTNEVDNGPANQIIGEADGAFGGLRSFRVIDDQDAAGSRVSLPVADEDIRLSATFSQAAANGATHEMEFKTRDSGGNVIWSFMVWRENTESGEFRVSFDTEDMFAESTDDRGTEVGSLSKSEPSKLEFLDPASSLKLRRGDTIIHDTGQAFSGAREFVVSVDDMEVILDDPSSGRGAVEVSLQEGDEVVMVKDDLAVHGLPGG